MYWAIHNTTHLNTALSLANSQTKQRTIAATKQTKLFFIFLQYNAELTGAAYFPRPV